MSRTLSPEILAMLLNDSEAVTAALKCMEENAEHQINQYKKTLSIVDQPKATIDQLFLPWMKKNSGCGKEEREMVLKVFKEIEHKYPEKTKDTLLNSLSEWNTENGHDPNCPYEVYEIPADPVNDFIHYYVSLQYPLGTIVDETNVDEVQIGLAKTQTILWLIQKELALIDSLMPSMFYHEFSCDNPHNFTEEQQQQTYQLIVNTIQESQSQTDLQFRINQLEDPSSETPDVLKQTAISYLKNLYLAGGNNDGSTDGEIFNERGETEEDLENTSEDDYE